MEGKASQGAKACDEKKNPDLTDDEKEQCRKDIAKCFCLWTPAILDLQDPSAEDLLNGCCEKLKGVSKDMVKGCNKIVDKNRKIRFKVCARQNILYFQIFALKIHDF